MMELSVSILITSFALQFEVVQLAAYIEARDALSSIYNTPAKDECSYITLSGRGSCLLFSALPKTRSNR